MGTGGLSSRSVPHLPSWMLGLKTNSKSDTHSNLLPSSTSLQAGLLSSAQPAEGDLLSGLDWGEGDVRGNVHCIVEGLMRKTVATARKKGGQKTSHDPRVTMEMRHQQVYCYNVLCKSASTPKPPPPLCRSRSAAGCETTQGNSLCSSS